jgi:hypothetical protein
MDNMALMPQRHDLLNLLLAIFSTPDIFLTRFRFLDL